jgi:alkylation response protein AidB-like acyl-CoA dehydrogenase
VHFAFTEDQELLRSTTRKFLEQRQPIGAVRERIESDVTLDRAVWAEGAQLGWFAFLVPEEHDGGSITSQPIIDLVAVSEELGRQLNPGPVLETNVVADVLARSGTADQQHRFLGPIARGECVATWCMSGDGTTHNDAIAVVATAVGNTVRLDGSACFVRDAHVADLLLVSVRSAEGPTLVLVSMPFSGVTVRVLKGLDLTRRLCEVTFNGVEVDATDIIGAPATAAPLIDRALQLATVLQSAESTGASEHLFETTVQYTKDRVQFGRAIGSFQAIKHRLANLAVTLESLRAMSRYAALALADEMVDRDEAVASAGSYVREASSFLTGESVQLHGGIGFTWEHDVHLFQRRAKTDEGLYGEPSDHRERLCALIEARVPTRAEGGH